MVNRADSSRNPSDFSSDTITENKEVRHLTFTPDPAQIYQRPTKTMAPISSMPPIVSYSRPSHFSS
jgi:pantothenate synthetase